MPIAVVFTVFYAIKMCAAHRRKSGIDACALQGWVAEPERHCAHLPATKISVYQGISTGVFLLLTMPSADEAAAPVWSSTFSIGRIWAASMAVRKRGSMATKSS